MANGNEKNSVAQTRESAEESLDTRQKNLQRLKGLSQQESGGSSPPTVGGFGPRVSIPDSELSEVREDLESDQVDLLRGNIRERRAAAQGPIETVSKETTKLIPEIPLTAAEYAGHILDIGSWNSAYHGAEGTIKRLLGADAESIQQSFQDAEDISGNEVGNAVTRWAKEQRQQVDDGELLGIDFETFRADPTDTVDWDDPAFYAQTGSDLMRSIFAFGGVAGALGAGTRGALGVLSRAVGAGSKMRSVLQGMGQIMTATEVAQAEGITTGIRAGERTYEKALQAHLEQGKSRREAERLAETAKNRAMATTGGINIMLLPALNFTSMLPAFRASSSLKSLSAAGLNREAGQTTGEWLAKINASGAPPQLMNNILRYAREAGFESAEELSNEFAQVEGEYRGQQLAGVEDPSTLGQRVSEKVFTEEGGLAAALGAIGGAGQTALMRNIPMHQRTNEEGDSEIVSAATLQAENHMKRFQQMKEGVKKRVQTFAEWQKRLKNASEAGNEQAIREAQEALLSTTVSSAFRGEGTEPTSTGLQESLNVGAEQQVKKMLEEIRNLDEAEAEERGFETDPDSPYHYSKLGEEYLKEIDELRGVWDKYQNDFSWTAEERVANMPAQLFNIEAQIRSMGRKEKRVGEQIENVQSAINELNDAAKGEEKNLGGMGTEVVKAKMDAVRKVVSQLEEQGNVPSDFDSIQDLKSAVDFDGIRSEYLQDATQRLQDATPEGQRPEIPDLDSFSSFLKSSLETDLLEVMDLVQAPGSDFNLQETLNPDNIESEERTYRTPTAKDASNTLEMEIRKQSLAQKQKLYRDQLNHLESPSGREAFMERFKEREVADMEERINRIRSDISELQSIEEVQEYRDQLSVNEAQAVKDALDAREEELETREKEQAPEPDQSDTEPTSGSQPQPPPPGMSAEEADEAREQAGDASDVERTPGQDSDQERTEQQAEDEPTGPSEPTQTFDVEPEPNTSPTEEAPRPPSPEREPDTPTEDAPEPSVLDEIKARASERENRMPAIVRKRVNNEIANLPEPDNADPEKPSVEEWVSEASDTMQDIFQDMRNAVSGTNSNFDNLINENRLPEGTTLEDIEPQANFATESEQSLARYLNYRQAILTSEAENKAMRRSTTQEEPKGGEPQNYADSQEEAQRDFSEETTETLSPKIGPRHLTVNYRSRPFRRNEDGEVIETSNERNEDLNKLVETPVVGEGMTIEYRVAEDISQGQNIDNSLRDNAKIEVYGITEDGNEIRLGALPLPQNIDSNGTQEIYNGDRNNIDTQKEKVQGLRQRILEAKATNPNARLTGKITEKRTGHISRKYTEESLGQPNPDRDVRPLSEAFSDEAFSRQRAEDERVQFYVLKDGRAHVSDNAYRSVRNNFSGNHSAVEGSVGVILPTPNGENIALPLHVPQVGQMSGLTESIYDILTDENLTPSQKRSQVEKYLFVSTGGSDQVFRNDADSEKPRIMFTENGVVIGMNNGRLYSTDSGFQRRSGNRVLNNLQGNEEAIKSLIDQMYLNVNLDRVNREQPMQPGDHDAGFLSQFGDQITYDDFLRQTLQTDLLEVQAQGFDGKDHFIYFEQPTILHEPTFQQPDQAGPSQQGASNREHRKPINLSAQESQVEREIEPQLASLTDNQVEDIYSDTLDALQNASENNQPSTYNSLYRRAEQLRDEAEARETLNADALPPLPDQAVPTSPEGGDEVSPVVEEGDVAFSTFTDTGEASDQIIQGIAERVAAGESLTEAEEAIRREHSDRVESALADIAEQGQAINESAMDFDPDVVDLSNTNDPIVENWWRNASFQESAAHFEDIYDGGDGEYNDVMSLLRDDVYEGEEWTYSTMGGDILNRRLQDQAEDAPSSTPATEGEVDAEVASNSASRWGGEADFSPGFGYTQPTEPYSEVDLSQPNFEGIVEAMQSDGQLQITCRA